jgi:hypothetical protein
MSTSGQSCHSGDFLVEWHLLPGDQAPGQREMNEMKNRIQILLRIACLACIITMVWFLLESRGTLAWQPPPPPNTPTSTPMPTATSRPTDMPVPTETPAPTNTPMPTDTAVPTPADTSTPLPMETQAASATPTVEQPSPAEPTATPERDEGALPVANPTNCRSVIEGHVVDGAGQRARGATVMAEGEGWSGAMLTDDQGQFGFGGLCPGETTLQAFLANGEASTSTTVSLTGDNSVEVDLNAGGQPATEAPTAAPTEQEVAQETETAAAGMPLTGFSGWLLAGSVLLAVLMLLTAGARRVLDVHEPSQD